jgi:hypothetical protein
LEDKTREHTHRHVFHFTQTKYKRNFALLLKIYVQQNNIYRFRFTSQRKHIATSLQNQSVNVQEETLFILRTKRFPTNALCWENVELMNATEDVTMFQRDASSDLLWIS